MTSAGHKVRPSAASAMRVPSPGVHATRYKRRDRSRLRLAVSFACFGASAWISSACHSSSRSAFSASATNGLSGWLTAIRASPEAILGSQSRRSAFFSPSPISRFAAR